MTLLCGALLAACFPSEPLDPYGVTLRDGAPTWVFAPGCSNSAAFSVLLLDGTSREASRLWMAQAEGDAPPLVGFTIGDPPPGYEDVQPLETELDPERQYGVVVLWGDRDEPGRSSVAFTPAELSPDHVKHRRGSLPLTDFRHDFACGDG